MDEREPITLKALVVMVFGAIAELVTVLGFDLPAGLQSAIVGVVIVAALVYLVVTGRRKVTVLANPRDADGARLVRADGKPLKRAK